MTAPIATIGEYADVVSGPAFKSDRFTDSPDDIPLIKGENIAQGYIAWDKSKYWPANEADSYERFALGPGDIVLAMDRPWITAGLKWARLKPHEPPSLLVQRVARLRARNGLRQDYLTYVIGSSAFSEYVRNIMGGTNVPHISGGQIKAFRFRIPSETEQAAVAETLSAYDDLIENNKRRIALLEESARLLYREWFVNLRFPGHEHVKVVEGVPEGWERTTLGRACVSLEDGDWIETKDQGGDDYRLLQISNIGVNEFVETGNFRYVTEETFSRLNCRELLPGHLLIARMPKPIGRAWLVHEMPWRMITAVDGAIAVADPEVADPYFLTYFINSPANLALCERRAVGATRPRITRRDVASLPLTLPPIRLQSQFREVVEPLNKQRQLLQRQVERLAEARDLLLPRLMSGEIAV